VVNASIDFLGTLPKGASLTIDIKDSDNKSSIASGPLCGVTVKGNTITGNTIIDPNVPQLWWPNGMGDQNLYYVTVTVVDENRNLWLPSPSEQVSVPSFSTKEILPMPNSPKALHRAPIGISRSTDMNSTPRARI
jgi:hypothetical protein